MAWLIAHPENRKKLRETLSGVYDLERLSTRIALNRTSRTCCRSGRALRRFLRSSQLSRPPMPIRPECSAPLRNIGMISATTPRCKSPCRRSAAVHHRRRAVQAGLQRRTGRTAGSRRARENRVKALLDEEQSLASASSSWLQPVRLLPSCPKPLAAHLPSILSAGRRWPTPNVSRPSASRSWKKTAFRRRPAQIA
ncbi:MAG: hypothetical protein ACLSAH_15525 [Bilophila wadsworthia]